MSVNISTNFFYHVTIYHVLTFNKRTISDSGMSHVILDVCNKKLYVIDYIISKTRIVT